MVNNNLKKELKKLDLREKSSKERARKKLKQIQKRIKEIDLQQFKADLKEEARQSKFERIQKGGVKKKKQTFGTKFLLGRVFKKPKKVKAIPTVKKVPIMQVSKNLQERRKQTLMRIIESNAPPIAKERARIMLARLK